jgi:hypothetical protein
VTFYSKKEEEGDAFWYEKYKPNINPGIEKSPYLRSKS